ncbi:MAG: type II toxin-antitoxin system HicB family antitoxin [Proteobacteria bacterium]|nr:type II toxin-antitoxin system HicB family antitoxin [Pseudomonadota bacterium]
MKRTFDYPLNLTADSDDGGFVVTFPDFPEVVTQGDTESEAITRAADALDEALAGRIKRGEDIPLPSRAKAEKRLASPSAFIAAKTALYVSMRESKLSQVALAQRLGCDEKEIRRMLEPHHPSKLPRLSAALSVLGKQLTVQLEDAR